MLSVHLPQAVLGTSLCTGARVGGWRGVQLVTTDLVKSSQKPAADAPSATTLRFPICLFTNVLSDPRAVSGRMHGPGC